MFGKDAPDYKKLKEERTNDREQMKYLESCFHTNIKNGDLDTMLDILSGNHASPKLPDEPDKITARPEKMNAVRKKFAFLQDMEDNDLDESAPSYRSASVSKYAEVFAELDRFRFASDPDKRKKQIAAVAKAVRGALQNFVPTEVFNNTKKVFGEYVEKGFQINGGVKILFALGDNKYMVSARGAFYGDEIIGIGKTDAGKMKPSVNRLLGEGDDTEDVSSDYAIDIQRHVES